MEFLVDGRLSQRQMTSRQTVLAFVEAINTHNLPTLGKLMTEDHSFIDAHGNEVVGREKMLAGWRGYFEWFPDYEIEVAQIFENGEEFGLFGYAGGSFKGNPKQSWRLPAAWKATVRDQRVALWQVYADTKIPFEIIQRGQ
jgi:ketosteroid isomerase-like protein